MLDVATGGKVALAVVAILAALVGIALAVRVYLQKRIEAGRARDPRRGLDGTTARSPPSSAGPVSRPSRPSPTFDGSVIDGAVNGVGGAVRGGGRGLRVLQTGFVRSYALGVAVGAVALLVYFLTRSGFWCPSRSLPPRAPTPSRPHR